MSILPPSRPKFNPNSALKIFRYFFGEEYKSFAVIEIAVRNRHNRINFYDDELFVWQSSGRYKTFNWNADPSGYLIKGTPKSILRTGVHPYCLSYHHKYDDRKRYVALRPKTPGEWLPVHRLVGGKFIESRGQAINQHKGGANSTWSEGCQTTHFSQYDEFINFIAEGLKYAGRIPIGIVSKPTQLLYNGFGLIPYILLTQEQFDHIVALDEKEFDSPADLKYQMANFASLPKVAKIEPVESEPENGNGILAAVEIDSAEGDRGEPVEPAPAESSFSFGGYLDKANGGIQNAQNAANSFGQAKATFDQIRGYLPGTGQDDPAVKVTTGKSISFWSQMTGKIISIFLIVLGFVKDNWLLIALGAFLFVLLVLVLVLVFYNYNKLKMMIFSDPDKYNVE